MVKDQVLKLTGVIHLDIVLCNKVCLCRPTLPVETGSDQKKLEFQIYAFEMKLAWMNKVSFAVLETV